VVKQRGNEIAKTALLGALIAGVGGLYLVAILNAVPPHPDLDIYIRGAKDLMAGRPLYDSYLHNPGDPTLRYGFIYPPLFAILLLPLSFLPAAAAPLVWLIVTHAALATAFWLVFRRLAASRTVTLLAIAVTLAFYPLWVEGSQAQANLPILLAVTLGIVGISAGKPRSGIWLGLAAALKLTPALLIIWLLWERRFRAAAWMVGAFSALTAVAALLRPADSLTYATKVLPILVAGTAYYSNQSVAGLAARLFKANPYTTPIVQLPWEPILVGLVVAGLLGYWLLTTPSRTLPTRGREIRGVSLPTRGREIRGVTFLPLVPLSSAVSWEHHLVILLPLVWVLIAKVSLPPPRPSPAGGGTAWKWLILALAVLCLMAIPHLPFGPPYGTDFARAAHTVNPLVILGANRLLLGTLILFIAAPLLLGQRWQTSTARAVASAWLPWRKRVQVTPASTWSSSELDQPA
jgi:alpha-1,2-mannosyltransferase